MVKSWLLFQKCSHYVRDPLRNYNLIKCIVMDCIFQPMSESPLGCYTAVVILDLLEKLYTSIILLLFFSCCSPIYRSLLLLLSLFLFFYSVGNIISFPLSPFPCQPHSFLSRLQCSSAIANGHWLYKSSSICCGVFILSVFHVIQGPTALAQSSYGAFIITLYNGD